jgi:hypothetical protein
MTWLIAPKSNTASNEESGAGMKVTSANENSHAVGSEPSQPTFGETDLLRVEVKCLRACCTETIKDDLDSDSVPAAHFEGVFPAQVTAEAHHPLRRVVPLSGCSRRTVHCQAPEPVERHRAIGCW